MRVVVISLINNFSANQAYSINGKYVICFNDIIKSVLNDVEGFHFRLFLPVSVFKFCMMSYQKAIENEEFTTDRVGFITAEAVSPDYAWSDELNIKPTSF